MTVGMNAPEESNSIALTAAAKFTLQKKITFSLYISLHNKLI